MKSLEQRTEVVTQGVKVGTIRQVVRQNKHLTLANIVHKTNCKLGGINYAPVQASSPTPE